MVAVEKIFDEAVNLPLENRVELVDRLLGSIWQTDETIDEAWLREAKRRKDSATCDDFVDVDSVLEKLYSELRAD